MPCVKYAPFLLVWVLLANLAACTEPQQIALPTEASLWPTNILLPPTATATATATSTLTPTATCTLTSTPQPTPTVTLSQTPLPTATPQPTATATPLPHTATLEPTSAPTAVVAQPPTAPGNASCAYIGNKNSKILHLPGCKDGAKMKAENRVCFASKEEAFAQGYNACKKCKP